METLDRNTMEELTGSMGPIPACGDAMTATAAKWSKTIPPCHCDLWLYLTEGLKACSEGFYVRCPGFERIERVCDFEPAIEAANWKEKVQLDRIAQLEARVQELEIKRKG